MGKDLLGPSKPSMDQQEQKYYSTLLKIAFMVKAIQLADLPNSEESVDSFSSLPPFSSFFRPFLAERNSKDMIRPYLSLV